MFKIAVRSTKNLTKFLGMGIWATPSESGPYRTLVKNCKVGDKLIFTVGGKPKALAVVSSNPSTDMAITLDTDTSVEEYPVTLGVTDVSIGELDSGSQVTLTRGIVSYSDILTYLHISTHWRQKKSPSMSLTLSA